MKNSKWDDGMKAVWNGQTLAEAEETVVVEGNHYFPPESIRPEFFEDIETTTICGWKGTANYFHLAVEGERNEDAAWTYREPREKAVQIKHHVAFSNGVETNS